MEVDFFRCESMLLKSYWIMVVMDVFTRRIVGFGVAAANLDGIDVCRMFNRATAAGSAQIPFRGSRSAVSLSSLAGEPSVTGG